MSDSEHLSPHGPSELPLGEAPAGEPAAPPPLAPEPAARFAAPEDIETVLADPFEELPLQDAPLAADGAAVDAGAFDAPTPADMALVHVPRVEAPPVSPWPDRWARVGGEI